MEKKSPAKAMGGNTRKQLTKSRGSGTHSAKIPKSVRMKEHNPARKGTRNMPLWMAGS